VRVTNGPRDLRLACQAPDPALLLRPIGAKDLECDRFSQHPVPGPEDLAAAALTDGRLDLKSGTQHRACLQARGLEWKAVRELYRRIEDVDVVWLGIRHPRELAIPPTSRDETLSRVGA